MGGLEGDDFFQCLKKAMANSEAFRWIPNCGINTCKNKVMDIAKNAFSKTWGKLKEEVTKRVVAYPKKIGDKATTAEGVRDLHATMLRLLGVDHQRMSVPFQGLDMKLTGVEPAQGVRPLLA